MYDYYTSDNNLVTPAQFDLASNDSLLVNAYRPGSVSGQSKYAYTGKVVKLVDFGAFVNFFGKRDGLVHVSQIANKRLNHPNELLKEGQEVKVKLLGFDDRGKVRLGMKMVDQETGEEIAPEKKEDAPTE